MYLDDEVIEIQVGTIPNSHSAFLTLATNIFESANFYVRKALIPYLQKLGSMDDTELELLAIIQVLNVEL